jgi:hypothetical protein
VSIDSGVDHTPARVSSAFAIGAAVLALGALVVSTAGVAVISGMIGVALILLGLYRGSRSVLTIGGGGLFFGVLVAGAFGARPRAVLIATVAVVLAWDAGTDAIIVGERLGRTARTRRIEIVHTAATTVVIGLAAGGGYLVYQLSAGGTSPVALIVLLVAAVLLTVAIRW